MGRKKKQPGAAAQSNPSGSALNAYHQPPSTVSSRSDAASSSQPTLPAHSGFNEDLNPEIRKLYTNYIKHLNQLDTRFFSSAIKSFGVHLTIEGTTYRQEPFDAFYHWSYQMFRATPTGEHTLYHSSPAEPCPLSETVILAVKSDAITYHNAMQVYSSDALCPWMPPQHNFYRINPFCTSLRRVLADLTLSLIIKNDSKESSFDFSTTEKINQGILFIAIVDMINFELLSSHELMGNYPKLINDLVISLIDHISRDENLIRNLDEINFIPALGRLHQNHRQSRAGFFNSEPPVLLSENNFMEFYMTLSELTNNPKAQRIWEQMPNLAQTYYGKEIKEITSTAQKHSTQRQYPEPPSSSGTSSSP